MSKDCCNDCFWEEQPKTEDYSKGFEDGVKYAQEKVTAMLGTRTFDDRENSLVYAAVAADVVRLLRG
jgi:basic membrane lipoprotein Med (substrate-binding protein (PBP1-ABC) superfamily)